MITAQPKREGECILRNANVNSSKVTTDNKLFAITDSSGRYVDENSIRYDEETGEWRYTSKKDYKYDRKDPINTGRHLYKSVDEANEVIDHLIHLLHKVNLHTSFLLVPVE